MARVVVVGGGFGGLSAAARLAKLRHDVTLLETSDRLGGRLLGHEIDGQTWQLSPDTVTLPGVLRDLFRKSGRPMDQVIGLEPEGPTRHVFADKSVLDLPLGQRSGQVDAVTALFGQDRWSPWVDSLPDVWDALRRATLDVSPPTFDHRTRKAVHPHRSLRALTKTMKDERLRKLLSDPARLEGSRPRYTPAFFAVDHYVERNFGRWRLEGGLPGLAAALEKRLGERRVDVRLQTHGLDVELRNKVAVGVTTDDGLLEADHVLWCAPRWPAALKAPRPLPAIPASRSLLTLGPNAPQLPLDIHGHGSPPVRLWSDGVVDAQGRQRWTLAHQRAEDPIIALARLGVDLRDHVMDRHDLTPSDLVRLGHWGWQWNSWRTIRERPHRVNGVWFAGAHAHPGATIEAIGMASAAIAEAIGPAPR